MTSRAMPGGAARSEPEAGEEERDRPGEAGSSGAGPVFGWTWLERPRARRAVWAVLAAEIITVAVFSVVYRPFDLNIYLWGGRSVTHGLRLYQVMADHNWFTYPPFSASLFTPLDAVPQVLVQLAWGLGTIAAIAWAALICLRLAGYRPSRTEVAAVTAAGVTLEPMYHTLFLGQVNVFLMALVLADIWRAARGRPAGIGTGLATAIKLTPAIFIALFLFTRRIRDAVTAMVTLGACILIGFLVNPGGSRLYWSKLFYDTRRVSVPYISNQSVYSAFVRIMGGAAHVGGWFQVIPLVLGVVGLVVAATLARRGDWLAAAAVTGGTGLLASPISWTHHWVWILPALIVALRGGLGARIGAAAAYVLFVLAPMWWTPHPGAAGTGQFGVHGLLTPVANCFMIAGLVFLGYMTVRTCRPRAGPPQPERDVALAGRGDRHPCGPSWTAAGRPGSGRRRTTPAAPWPGTPRWCRAPAPAPCARSSRPSFGRPNPAIWLRRNVGQLRGRNASDMVGPLLLFQQQQRPNHDVRRAPGQDHPPTRGLRRVAGGEGGAADRTGRAPPGAAQERGPV